MYDVLNIQFTYESLLREKLHVLKLLTATTSNESYKQKGATFCIEWLQAVEIVWCSSGSSIQLSIDHTKNHWNNMGQPNAACEN